MTVCPSCGSEVADFASFCTSCGQRLAADARPDFAASTSAPVCSSCGALVDASSAFCTACGQRRSSSPPAPLVETAPAVPAAAAAVAPIETAREAAPQPASIQTAAEPVPQVASPSYPAPSEYQQPRQARGSKFGVVVLVLLLVIVAGVCGAWYFWGVEAVVVCSPPDVTVFLDDKELAPTSFGRYVIPHLSRQTHFLKVQRPGFADTIQRLDFPLTSLHEWVNIKLVPSRQTRPASSR